MTTGAGGDDGGSVVAGRFGLPGQLSTGHEHVWSRSDGDGEPRGSDHGTEVLEWRPGYQHEVTVVACLRHVSCPSTCEETPAAVLRIDNADHAGEIAMTADDLSSMVEGLLRLRRALLATSRDAPGDDARAPRDDR